MNVGTMLPDWNMDIKQKCLLFFIKVYKFQFFSQVPLNILTHGLAFHPELAVNPQHPYIPDAYPIIREMVQQRASVLLEASESNDLGVF